MFGGSGDDIFRPSHAPQFSRITDVEQGYDRIDLSDPGRPYDLSELAISARSYGALFSFGGMSLRVAQPRGGKRHSGQRLGGG